MRLAAPHHPSPSHPTRPPAKQTAQIPDAVVSHYARLLDDSGIMPLIDAELGPRPGPPGLPIAAVLTCLLLSINHTGKATLVEAWRIATFCPTAAARHRLGLPEVDPADVHQVLASSRRFYRAFDRLTTVLDPARHDRRARPSTRPTRWPPPGKMTTQHTRESGNCCKTSSPRWCSPQCAGPKAGATSAISAAMSASTPPPPRSSPAHLELVTTVRDTVITERGSSWTYFHRCRWKSGLTRKRPCTGSRRSSAKYG
ncbi:hypothetical protein SMD20_47930 [Nonomuraea sp. LP-02]|uniref:hypothetical protein n=1 Tax=Nonomuraea sp. LP-02 TaxID=3097960 RepID=UPI002E31D44C|nr:hypothetical protein [Nonomuraea sp. LP-02]MED7932020.1 hypothetical protein [Nonomuraea sp. LP-02]